VPGTAISEDFQKLLLSLSNEAPGDEVTFQGSAHSQEAEGTAQISWTTFLLT
jgi:hypothetical protein